MLENFTDTSNTPNQFRDQSASHFLLLILIGDLVYIGLGCVNDLTLILNNPLLTLWAEQGFAEMYQYLKYFWIVLLLVRISWKTRMPQYLAWSLVFFYLLLDDSLQIHERAGTFFTAKFDFVPPFGLTLQDVGELTSTAIAVFFMFFPTTWAYMKGSTSFKKISQDLCILVVVLGFFGVIMDMADVVFGYNRTVKFILGMVEDGGEMFAASLALWYVFRMGITNDTNRIFLIDNLRHRISRARR